MKSNRSWKGILLIVLLLAIGFATVTTTLIINGTINFGANNQNFIDGVVFKSAKLTYSEDTEPGKAEVTTGLISADGKQIDFTVSNLTLIGETATLTYTIGNDSQYVAELSDLVCTVKDGDTDVTNAVWTAQTGDYIKIEHDNLTGVTIPVEGVTGEKTLKITMIKSYVGPSATENTKTYKVSCEIEANGSDYTRS